MDAPPDVSPVPILLIIAGFALLCAVIATAQLTDPRRRRDRSALAPSEPDAPGVETAELPDGQDAAPDTASDADRNVEKPPQDGEQAR